MLHRCLGSLSKKLDLLSNERRNIVAVLSIDGSG